MGPPMRTIEDRLAVIANPATDPKLRACLATSEVSFLQFMISSSRFNGKQRESPTFRPYVDQLRFCQAYLASLSPANTDDCRLTGNPLPPLPAELGGDRRVPFQIQENRPSTVRRIDEQKVSTMKTPLPEVVSSAFIPIRKSSNHLPAATGIHSLPEGNSQSTQLLEFPSFVNEFNELRQQGSLSEYQTQFAKLKSLMARFSPELDEEFFISRFISGLEEELRPVLSMLQPYIRTLSQPYNRAQWEEDAIAACKLQLGDFVGSDVEQDNVKSAQELVGVNMENLGSVAAAETNGSYSEVSTVSVDGHVLPALVSTSKDYTWKGDLAVDNGGITASRDGGLATATTTNEGVLLIEKALETGHSQLKQIKANLVAAAEYKDTASYFAVLDTMGIVITIAVSPSSIESESTLKKSNLDKNEPNVEGEVLIAKAYILATGVVQKPEFKLLNINDSFTMLSTSHVAANARAIAGQTIDSIFCPGDDEFSTLAAIVNCCNSNKGYGFMPESVGCRGNLREGSWDYEYRVYPTYYGVWVISHVSGSDPDFCEAYKAAFPNSQLTTANARNGTMVAPPFPFVLAEDGEDLSAADNVKLDQKAASLLGIANTYIKLFDPGGAGLPSDFIATGSPRKLYISCDFEVDDNYCYAVVSKGRGDCPNFKGPYKDILASQAVLSDRFSWVSIEALDFNGCSGSNLRVGDAFLGILAVKGSRISSENDTPAIALVQVLDRLAIDFITCLADVDVEFVAVRRECCHSGVGHGFTSELVGCSGELGHNSWTHGYKIFPTYYGVSVHHSVGGCSSSSKQQQ